MERQTVEAAEGSSRPARSELPTVARSNRQTRARRRSGNRSRRSSIHRRCRERRRRPYSSRWSPPCADASPPQNNSARQSLSAPAPRLVRGSGFGRNSFSSDAAPEQHNPRGRSGSGQTRFVRKLDHRPFEGRHRRHWSEPQAPAWGIFAVTDTGRRAFIGIDHVRKMGALSSQRMADHAEQQPGVRRQQETSAERADGEGSAGSGCLPGFWRREGESAHFDK
jgi:hypothetical protein